MTGKARGLVANLLNLVDNGILRATLDDAPLMFGDRAKGAAAETAAHDIHRMLDHIVGGDACFAVG